MEMNEPPALQDFVPATRVRRSPPAPRLSSSDFFRLGFYGGLGLWCAFALINLAVLLGLVAILMMLGVLSATAVPLLN